MPELWAKEAALETENKHLRESKNEQEKIKKEYNKTRSKIEKEQKQKAALSDGLNKTRCLNELYEENHRIENEISKA